MSRARSVEIDGIQVWFDTNLDGRPATVDQIELLADAQGIEIDDLLDANLNQGQVILGLRQAIHGNVIPADVLERRRARRARQQQQPMCRICGVEGNSTRHHFVPRWIMRELRNYDDYSSRTMCTVPVCVECHKALHGKDASDKSIVPYLRPHEAELAIRMLDDLQVQHPKIFGLIAGGDEYTYEGTLLKDYREHRLHRLAAGAVEFESQVASPEESLTSLVIPMRG